METNVKRIACLLSIGLILSLAGTSFAEMYLQGVGGDHAMSATHDRFYSGPDKAFIGAALDFSGVSAWGPWATMISPQYFITAYHWSASYAPSLTFYEGNTTAAGGHTYTVDTSFHLTLYYNGQPADVQIGRLTAPIPAADHIAYYPVLSLATTADYIGMTIYNYGNPNRLGRNVISNIAPYYEGGENGWGMFYNYDLPGLGADETYLIGGDSGGPSFAVVDGKLALLGEHFSTYGTSGLIPFDGGAPKAGDGSWWSVDGFLPAYIDQINAALPANQQLTTIPEPASLTLLGLGALAMFRRRK